MAPSSSPPPHDSGEYRAWLFERLNSIEDRLTRHNAAMTAKLESGFMDLRKSFDVHTQEDREFYDRVLIIETQRAMEKEHARRAGAIWGTMAGAAVGILFKAVAKVFGS